MVAQPEFKEGFPFWNKFEFIMEVYIINEIFMFFLLMVYA